MPEIHLTDYREYALYPLYITERGQVMTRKFVLVR